MSIQSDRDRRTAWMMHERFGMFIHWGLYAIPARGEWIRNWERIDADTYQKYFDEFDPVDYDPKTWARLARQAGMKYAVMTAKHHDGFCLFDSALTDYKATNTKAGRDLIREYVEAFREEGLKVGFYYSLLDWHHPDYPAYADRHHPMRGNEAYRNQTGQHFDRYVEYLHGQVEELLTNYGKIDLLWFDFSYDDMTGEKWQATKLVERVRALQPDIIIDNRLGGNLRDEQPAVYSGDFGSPENIIPPDGMFDAKGNPIPWEECMTLNNHWGYAAADHDYKDAQSIIHILVECVSKNGNLLLNVGPDAKGNIPQESADILREVGDWMKQNASSIYGCGRCNLPKPEWGRLTQSNDKIYVHIYESVTGAYAIQGLGGKVERARLLRDGSEVNLAEPWNVAHYGGAGRPDQPLFVQLPSFRLPDGRDTVVELTLKPQS